jgi:ankyrin repeat protein
MPFFKRKDRSGSDPGKSPFGGNDPMQDMPYRSMTLRPNEAEQKLLNDELLSAVIRGDIRDVRDSLSRRADAKAWDDGQMTPLMLAAMFGRTEIGRALIEAGADPSAKIKDGMYAGFDAAVFARMSGDNGFCAMLEERGIGSGWRNGRRRED